MRMTISGIGGTGKSTLARAVSERLGVPLYSAGSVIRALAEEQSVDPLVIERRAENLPQIDRLINARICQFAQNNPNFVLEGWFVWHVVRSRSGIFRVKLTCNDAVRFKRIAARQKIDRKHAARETKAREATLVKRFGTRYGVPDWNSDDHFNLVIDTTHLSSTEIVDRVLAESQSFFAHDP